MAHKKAASKTTQKGNRTPKYRGVKKYGGEVVKIGQIIVRQLGTVIKPGLHVGMGKDFTIFAKADGIVSYRNVRKGKKEVSVKPAI